MGHDTEEDLESTINKNIEYYGGVGELVCRVCQRNVCNIHSNSKFGVCSDCFSEGKGKDLREVHEVEPVQENKATIPVGKRNWSEFLA